LIATLWAARLLAGRFVAHRSKTTAGILPLRFAHPAKMRGSATTPVTDLVHEYGYAITRDSRGIHLSEKEEGNKSGVKNRQSYYPKNSAAFK